MTDDRAGGPVSRRLRLAPAPESARRARDAVLDALLDAGRPDLIDAASLLVSEVVTNAVVHARTPIDLEVRVAGTGVRVSVRDASTALPTQRHYGQTATTGRGLALVELMSDRYGTDVDSDNGKTVWFELGSPAGGGDVPPPAQPQHVDAAVLAVIDVQLLNLPVPLALAWQQHADTLLREFMLASWDDVDAFPGAPADQGAAHDAFAALASGFEGLRSGGEFPEYADLSVRVERDLASRFQHLDALLDHVLNLAEEGLTLAPPTQPEIRAFRRWAVGEVLRQSRGASPSAWEGVPEDIRPAAVPPVAWDSSAVRNSTSAVVAADDLNRIIAASPAALELLGWGPDLVGRRIVTIIPTRFRDAHIAAFTLNLLTGAGAIIDREVTVPALRKDGSEVEVVLVVRRAATVNGRTIFTADMREA